MSKSISFLLCIMDCDLIDLDSQGHHILDIMVGVLKNGFEKAG